MFSCTVRYIIQLTCQSFYRTLLKRAGRESNRSRTRHSIFFQNVVTPKPQPDEGRTDKVLQFSNKLPNSCYRSCCRFMVQASTAALHLFHNEVFGLSTCSLEELFPGMVFARIITTLFLLFNITDIPLSFYSGHKIIVIVPR